MYKTVWILGYLLYRLVQVFFHQQYGCYSMTISSSISIDFPRARAISSVVLKTSLQGNSNNVDQQHSSQCERLRLIGKCWSKEPSMKTLTILSLWYIYLATLSLAQGVISALTQIPFWLIGSVFPLQSLTHRVHWGSTAHSEVPNLLKAPGQGWLDKDCMMKIRLRNLKLNHICFTCLWSQKETTMNLASIKQGVTQIVKTAALWSPFLLPCQPSCMLLISAFFRVFTI